MYDLGHMTKMATMHWPRWPCTMPISGKTLKNIFFSGTAEGLDTWFVEFRRGGGGFYKVYINDDPGLIMTYFTARSDLAR